MIRQPAAPPRLEPLHNLRAATLPVKHPETDPLVVLDGKVACNAKKQNVVSAISVPSGRVQGVQPVLAGTNEITAARLLIDCCQLEERLVSLDALHTQDETAANWCRKRAPITS